MRIFTPAVFLVDQREFSERVLDGLRHREDNLVLAALLGPVLRNEAGRCFECF